MFNPSDFHNYQTEAYHHLLEHNASMLWLSMGLGKTVVTLTAIKTLQTLGQVKGVLVVAPLRVCRTVWKQEADKWSHLQGLRFSFVLGNAQQRQQALLRRADIYLINYENIPWLTQQIEHYWLGRGQYAPFDMIVWDEVSKMKNATSKRTSSIARILPFFNRRVGLTGTPASNGLKDLHGQFLVVDNGARLGEKKTMFMAKYFYGNQRGHILSPFPDTEDRIKKRIGDITMLVDGSAVDRPPFTYNDIHIVLEGDTAEQYRRLEEEMFLELDSGEEVEVFNAATKTNKCLQFANGAVYTDPETRAWTAVHDEKLDALTEIVDETGDDPLLVAYSYRSDVARIKERYPEAVNLTEVKGSNLEAVVAKWNQGGIKMLMGHPACLHPRTQVLTEHRGWVRIVDVTNFERVFDGEEFVSHGGCSFSGVKEVIDVFGVTMTPGHRLLVNGIWRTGEDVRGYSHTRRTASYQYQGDDKYLSEMCEVRESVEDTKTERSEAQSTEPRDDCKRSSSQREGVQVSEEPEVSDVYDLVDCGPRHQFLVRNFTGEMFISHNSIGHGLNLQQGGHNLVWFGLPWSLDLYEQFNARLYRQGQTAPVICHRILTDNTLDMGVRDALVDKAGTQDSIRDAIRKYRATVAQAPAAFAPE